MYVFYPIRYISDMLISVDFKTVAVVPLFPSEFGTNLEKCKNQSDTSQNTSFITGKTGSENVAWLTSVIRFPALLSLQI